MVGRRGREEEMRHEGHEEGRERRKEKQGRKGRKNGRMDLERKGLRNEGGKG